MRSAGTAYGDGTSGGRSAERREDIAPNVDYELDRHAEREGERVTFNKEARADYLAFAMSPAARWQGNFRDLAASVTRMATFSPKGRIDVAVVAKEIDRLKRLWADGGAEGNGLERFLSPDALADLGPFDRVQLAYVVDVCASARTLSEAGRKLFAASREKRTSTNDADRLRKYLARFGLRWEDFKSGQSS